MEDTHNFKLATANHPSSGWILNCRKLACDEEEFTRFLSRRTSRGVKMATLRCQSHRHQTPRNTAEDDTRGRRCSSTTPDGVTTRPQVSHTTVDPKPAAPAPQSNPQRAATTQISRADSQMMPSRRCATQDAPPLPFRADLE